MQTGQNGILGENDNSRVFLFQGNLSVDEIFFAVKTTKKYHEDRGNGIKVSFLPFSAFNIDAESTIMS